MSYIPSVVREREFVEFDKKDHLYMHAVRERLTDHFHTSFSFSLSTRR
jgi:hypothetical protein